MLSFIGKFHTSVATFPTRSKLYLRGLAIVAVSPWRILKNAVVTVIKDQQALIKGNRGRVLTNRWQAAGRHRERKFPQRRKLVPLFRRISQDPLDRGCFIIQTNDKILAA